MTLANQEFSPACDAEWVRSFGNRLGPSVIGQVLPMCMRERILFTRREIFFHFLQCAAHQCEKPYYHAYTDCCAFNLSMQRFDEIVEPVVHG